jgi:hypothetical protein
MIYGILKTYKVLKGDDVLKNLLSLKEHPILTVKVLLPPN